MICCQKYLYQYSPSFHLETLVGWRLSSLAHWFHQTEHCCKKIREIYSLNFSMSLGVNYSVHERNLFIIKRTGFWLLNDMLSCPTKIVCRNRIFSPLRLIKQCITKGKAILVITNTCVILTMSSQLVYKIFIIIMHTHVFYWREIYQLT
jgi:hypothetical protein